MLLVGLTQTVYISKQIMNKQNKNAFQWDVYHLLVDRIPACTGQGGVYPSMHWAGGCIPACTGQGGVYPSMHWAGAYPSMHWAGGCLSSGMSPQGGVCPEGGVFPQGGDVGCLPRGCLPGGRCLPTGCLAPGPETDTPPWIEWQTGVKHYLAAYLLRAVKI